jgi:D-alanyl-D-alanine carboxypeptidase/D-alanyl-D-alanine-endopeptidase (penicillin-binding protein 4)
MVGLGHRIGRTLRVPGRGLRRVIVLLVVLVTAGATGSAGRAEHAVGARGAAPDARRRRAARAAPPRPRAAGRERAQCPAGPVWPPPSGTPADAVPGTFSGVVLDPASNQVLWQRTSGTPLVPARPRS